MLNRCTPLNFTAALGGAVAARPIAVRFVDERTIENNSDNSGCSNPWRDDNPLFPAQAGIQ
jgi:hypothetical protein